MKALLPLLFLLSACVTDEYYAQNGSKILHHKRNQFGGTASFNRGDGSSEANDMQTSARDFFSTVATVAGTVSAAYIQNSDNSLSATQSTNAANQAIKTTQSNNALEAVKVQATPTILNEGQTAVFPKP